MYLQTSDNVSGNSPNIIVRHCLRNTGVKPHTLNVLSHHGVCNVRGVIVSDELVVALKMLRQTTTTWMGDER
jgi:hypothetical protein